MELHNCLQLKKKFAALEKTVMRQLNRHHGLSRLTKNRKLNFSRKKFPILYILKKQTPGLDNHISCRPRGKERGKWQHPITKQVQFLTNR